MNLPKQSRPVIRDVSRDPIRPRVEGAQPPPNPLLAQCLAFCQRMAPGYPREFCTTNCYGTYGNAIYDPLVDPW
jgi:hypothetical protein